MKLKYILEPIIFNNTFVDDSSFTNFSSRLILSYEIAHQCKFNDILLIPKFEYHARVWLYMSARFSFHVWTSLHNTLSRSCQFINQLINILKDFLLNLNICLFAQYKYTNTLSFFIMMHMINALILAKLNVSSLKLYIVYYLVGWKLVILFRIKFLLLLIHTIRLAFVNLFCKPHILHFYYNGLQRRNGPTCYLT